MGGRRVAAAELGGAGLAEDLGAGDIGRRAAAPGDDGTHERAEGGCLPVGERAGRRRLDGVCATTARGAPGLLPGRPAAVSGTVGPGLAAPVASAGVGVRVS